MSIYGYEACGVAPVSMGRKPGGTWLQCPRSDLNPNPSFSSYKSSMLLEKGSKVHVCPSLVTWCSLYKIQVSKEPALVSPLKFKDCSWTFHPRHGDEALMVHQVLLVSWQSPSNWQHRVVLDPPTCLRTHKYASGPTHVFMKWVHYNLFQIRVHFFPYLYFIWFLDGASYNHKLCLHNHRSPWDPDPLSIPPGHWG